MGVSGKEQLRWDFEVCLFMSQCRSGMPVTSQNIPPSPAAAEGGSRNPRDTVLLS